MEIYASTDKKNCFDEGTAKLVDKKKTNLEFDSQGPNIHLE